MDIELEKLKKLEHALCDAIDILRDWQIEEAKPEEEKCIAYLAREPFKGKYCYLTACLESRWETVQKEYGAKTKLFVGAYDEVQEWYKARDKFASVIKAWEDGKKIQVTPKGTDKWLDLHCEPKWDLRDEYRVKPEYPCEDGIDSKACAGCEHSEDGKPEADKMPPTWTNPHDCNGCLYEKQSGMEEPCSDCFLKRLFTPKEKQYRPYESSAEMIADFIDRFKVKCPSYCEPLIWVKNKLIDINRFLVWGFRVSDVSIGGSTVTYDLLFERYTYLDGSTCGMEVKK